MITDSRQLLAISVANDLTAYLFDFSVVNSDQANFIFDRLADSLIEMPIEALTNLRERLDGNQS